MVIIAILINKNFSFPVIAISMVDGIIRHTISYHPILFHQFKYNPGPSKDFERHQVYKSHLL